MLAPQQQLDELFVAAPEAAIADVRAFLTRYSRAGVQPYPFGNPVSIERRHVPEVRAMAYWATEKTDGVRVCILMTRTAAPTTPQVDVAYLMDRTGRLYGFPVSCVGSFFDGTLLDAELVYKPALGQHVLYVFDVAVIDGVDVSSDPLSARLQTIREAVPSGMLMDDAARRTALFERFLLCTKAGVHILSKTMYQLPSQAPQLLAALPGLGHASDGFVLTPEHEPASRPGTAWSVYKIKTTHTMDLQWTSGRLWYGNAADLHPLDSIIGAPAVIQPLAEPLPVLDFTIVEMAPRLQPDGSFKLEFQQARPDRDAPNNLTCVLRTLQSALDAVQLSDFMVAI